MEQAMYMQVVPNSHSFGSLENILVHYSLAPEEVTKEYIVVGFKNTLNRGSDLVFNPKNMKEVPPPTHFHSLANIFKYLVNEIWDVERFIELIKNTLDNGFDFKNERKMERTDVYKCLDTERDYQDLRWSVRRNENGTPDAEKPPIEWITYIEYHLNEAKNAVYNLEDEETLAQVRKVAALAVRCLELHGCPERVIPEELLNDEN